MSVNVTTNYQGEVAEALLTLMKDGNQAVEKGSVYVEAGVSSALHIDRFRVSDDQLQDRQEDPTVPSDSISYDEVTLTPLDIMFFDTVNPRTFEDVWRPYQPVGPLVDKVDSPKIQAAIISEVLKSIGKQLGKLIWAGDIGAGGGSPLRFFDGYVTLAAASGDTIDVTPVGVITAANVIAILEATEAAIPADIWEDPNTVFHMNTTDYRLYLEAARLLDFKGSNIGDALENRFASRQIRFYSGFPKDRIMVAKGTAGRDSNLWAGLDTMGDEENVKIERFRPESEKFIIKVLFKYAVQVGNFEEVVLYQPV